jgi:hypothetical protein
MADIRITEVATASPVGADTVLGVKDGQVKRFAVSDIANSMDGAALGALSASGGAALVGFVQSGAGAVARTAQDKGRDALTALDYVVGDGSTDDGAKFAQLATYAASTGRPIDISRATIKLTTWASALAVSGTLRIVGGGSGKIVGNGNDIFSLGDGASFEIAGIRVEDAGRMLTLSGVGSYPLLSARGCVFSNTKAFLLSGAQDIDRLELIFNIFDTIADEAVCHSSSYVKSAFIHGNRFNDIASATSDLQVVRLGKTSLADQALTGDYIITGNVFDTMTAGGSSAGEVHAVILYGNRGVVSGNIIKYLDRPLARQSGGVEGIYLKCANSTVTGNVLVDAGFAEGNKGAMIWLKGEPHAPVSEIGGYNATVTGNVLYCTDGELRNGIQCVSDNLVVANNTLVGMNGVHAICIAWATADSENGVVTGNVIAQPNITGSMIRINAIGKNLKVSGNVLGANATGGSFAGITYTDDNRAGNMVGLDISGNMIDATGIDYSVLLIKTNNAMTNLSVNDNQIVGGGYGIRTLSATYITSGECRRNRMTGTTTAFRDKATSPLRFSDNTKDNAPADGWADAPAAGTWAVGEIVLNANPVAGGYLGWVCVGAPGTWKPYGLIAE